MRRNTPQIAHQAKKKILIIDSDPVTTALLRSYLEDEKGYFVLTAGSGSAGVRIAVERLPDLILLDFRLTDMSGLEVHDKLRLKPVTDRIPIVYVSSFLTLRVVEQASDKGAKGVLRKPFTLSEMYRKVATVLSST